ncbi:MAG: DUF2079 domain-containing protein, partial [Thermoplasmata archaeon]
MVTLGLLVLLFAVATIVLSWVRALELETTTWDMGIYQQALWSTAHGRSFFETADLETGGFGSFLEVHSAFVLFLLVPLYREFPGPLALFVVQSSAVGLAAIPLALFAGDRTGSARWGAISGVVYLAYAPLVAASLYDFHAESFLPLELFAFLFLWNRGRYGLGFVAATAAFLTFEIAPLLLFAAGLFFLWPDGGALRPGEGSGVGVGGWLRRATARAATSPGRVRTRATALLLAASVAAYALLLEAREHWIAPLLGVGTFPVNPSGVGYVIGATPGELGLAVGNLSVGLSTKLLAWAVAIALLGFVPLFAPRAWLLAVPWLGFSLFSQNLNYVIPGFPNGFIHAAGLLPALALGLPRIARA